MSVDLALLWTHIDLLISPFLFPFCFYQSSYSSFMSAASHKFFHESAASRFSTPLPFVCPVSSFEWICFVPLVSAPANLPHRRGFGLLFHPPTLGKTVCSKDCNLTANLYGFLRGRAPSPAEWFAKDVRPRWSLWSSLQAWVWRQNFAVCSQMCQLSPPE